MSLTTTKYPERYRRKDDAPEWFEYQQRLPIGLGRDLGHVAGIDGTIVAAKQDPHSGSAIYYKDPDCVLMGAEGFTHYIWLCDQWQRFECRHMLVHRIRRDSDIRNSGREV